MIHQELSIDWLPDSEIDKFAFQCSHLSCISCTLFFLSFLSHLLQTLFLPFQFCLSVRHIDRLDGKFEENRQIEIMIILQTKRKWNHLKTKIYPSREGNENYYSDFRWNSKQTIYQLPQIFGISAHWNGGRNFFISKWKLSNEAFLIKPPIKSTWYKHASQ